MAYYGWYSGDELYHYGIPGQKWGQRRFQNPDGSLTAEGRQRYGRIAERHYRAGRALSNYAKKHSGTRLGSAAAKAAKRQVQIGNSYRNSKSQNSRDKKLQTALKVGAGVTAAALAGYGAYRLAKSDTRAGQKIRNTAINARFLAKEAGASARGLARNASEIAVLVAGLHLVLVVLVSKVDTLLKNLEQAQEVLPLTLHVLAKESMLKHVVLQQKPVFVAAHLLLMLKDSLGTLVKLLVAGLHLVLVVLVSKVDTLLKNLEQAQEVLPLMRVEILVTRQIASHLKLVIWQLALR